MFGNEIEEQLVFFWFYGHFRVLGWVVRPGSTADVWSIKLAPRHEQEQEQQWSADNFFSPFFFINGRREIHRKTRIGNLGWARGLDLRVCRCRTTLRSSPKLGRAKRQILNAKQKGLLPRRRCKLVCTFFFLLILRSQYLKSILLRRRLGRRMRIVGSGA